MFIALSFVSADSASSEKKSSNPHFKQVDKYIDEQKMEKALTEAEGVLRKARQKKDEQLIAESLVVIAQLHMALHQYDTAANFLRQEKWPQNPSLRILLNMFYAQTLTSFFQAYRWDIQSREATAQSKKDLSLFNTEDINREILKTWSTILESKVDLNSPPPEFFYRYIDKNDYPSNIRSTLRDTVTYMAVDYLSDSSYWTAKEENEVYKLNFSKLIRGQVSTVPLMDGKHHPLEKVAGRLIELAQFHKQNGKVDAELEARYMLISKFLDFTREPADKKTIVHELQTMQKSYRRAKWWSKGQALLTQYYMHSDTDNSKNLIQAFAEAEKGIQADAKSYGGQLCAYYKSQILAPAYRLDTMLVDGIKKDSVVVHHKNISKLYFRAYRYDLNKAMKTSGGDIWAKLRDQKWVTNAYGVPVQEWSQSLPATPDYREHTTFLQPPLEKRGVYIIVASLRSDFVLSGENNVVAVPIIISDIVLQRWVHNSGELEVKAIYGETGLSASGVLVSTWARKDWSSPLSKRGEATTDASGSVTFKLTKEKYNYSREVQLAKKGDSYALLGESWANLPQSGLSQSIFIFTDRSIFRPQQKVQWKVLSFSGNLQTTKYQAKKNEPLIVELRDLNGNVVHKKTVTTNVYGTASGEFLIPEGRALGSWSLVVQRKDASQGLSSSVIQVEEYKRPTFEVNFKDTTTTSLRLNRQATLVGEARYYFGQAVTEGRVKWRVVRTPEWSWWWYGERGPALPETIATGESPIFRDGTFRVSFLPKADERQKTAQQALKYRFTIEADVTDSGGETRQGKKIVSLGFVSVEATVALNNEFFLEKTKITIPIKRVDLNGEGKPGSGSWKLVKVREPETTSLPADLPKEQKEKSNGEYATLGDQRRMRWETSFSVEEIMRAWPDGDTVTQGSLVHDKKGEAVVSLQSLSAGVYRLLYSTKDDFGESLNLKTEIIVTGKSPKIALPLVLLAEKEKALVGEKIRFFVASGLKDQPLTWEVYRNQKRIVKKDIKNGELFEWTVKEEDRGGFTVQVSGVRDYQRLEAERSVAVPWDNKELKVEMATFRNKIRPGQKETFKVVVKDYKGHLLKEKGAELLAFMYDRSLDFFTLHEVESPLGVYPVRTGSARTDDSLTYAVGLSYYDRYDEAFFPPTFDSDHLILLDNNYAIGGVGARAKGGEYEYAYEGSNTMLADVSAVPGTRLATPKEYEEMTKVSAKPEMSNGKGKLSLKESIPQPSEVRHNFSETAFWRPHLLIDKKGTVTFEFQVPDSLTSWKLWVNAITKDISYGAYQGITQSVKDLMVRSYLPRFLREGDAAEIKVVVNNGSDKVMNGQLQLAIEESESGKSAIDLFHLSSRETKKTFSVPANGSTAVIFRIQAPNITQSFAFTVRAQSKNFSDGEKRLLPILPSRMHLAQSRFVTLNNKDHKVIEFKDMAKRDDPTRIDDRLVLTIDGQLFYGVLKSLPYLIEYPYECVEQTLNRYLSTGIIHSLFNKYPAVAKMAQQFSKRKTSLELFSLPDENQRMTIEESPWQQMAAGGSSDANYLKNVLDRRLVKKERDRALDRLKKMQRPDGGFSWFEGGPASEYMTLYVLMGLARGLEFQVEAPKDLTVRAWSYMHDWVNRELPQCIKEKRCHEWITELNFVLSSYKDLSWTGNHFTESDRKKYLDYSFASWKQHSSLLKGYLALALYRAGRTTDAKLVWESVMDSAKSTEELGTYWAPEEKSWLWYNDTIETHAFALRVQMELAPNDKKNEGLVQWLFLNKKLNHWKSTRATAESIYALVHYLEKEKVLGVREEIQAHIGGEQKTFIFNPDEYAGGKNQVVIDGTDIQPSRDYKIGVMKNSPGFAFASATWHFSTEKNPAQGDSDFFSVERKYFLRENKGGKWVLRPLHLGANIHVGDQVEVHLSIRTKHAAEYVHLRDPRGAGFEPEEVVSGYRYDKGLSYYQEVRDSGENYFFNWLPVGEYTFKYRIRANMAGKFRIGPATIQSMYAPEFNAYSAGGKLDVRGM